MRRRPSVTDLGLRCWWPWLFAVVGLALLEPGSPVAAVDGDVNRARAKYPNIAGTRLDDCLLCHPAGSHQVNPYGRDYSRNRGDFGAIEGLDSDGDGFTNLAEILALTFPGDPHDMPAPTPTGGPTMA